MRLCVRLARNWLYIPTCQSVVSHRNVHHPHETNPQNLTHIHTIALSIDLCHIVSTRACFTYLKVTIFHIYVCASPIPFIWCILFGFLYILYCDCGCSQVKHHIAQWHNLFVTGKLMQQVQYKHYIDMVLEIWSSEYRILYSCAAAVHKSACAK